MTAVLFTGAEGWKHAVCQSTCAASAAFNCVATAFAPPVAATVYATCQIGCSLLEHAHLFFCKLSKFCICFDFFYKVYLNETSNFVQQRGMTQILRVGLGTRNIFSRAGPERIARAMSPGNIFSSLLLVIIL